MMLTLILHYHIQVNGYTIVDDCRTQNKYYVTHIPTDTRYCYGNFEENIYRLRSWLRRSI